MSIQARIRAIQNKGRNKRQIAEFLGISVGLLNKWLEDEFSYSNSTLGSEIKRRIWIYYIAVILSDMFEKMVAMILVLVAVSISSLIEGLKKLINITKRT